MNQKSLPARFKVAVFPLANTVLFPGVTLPLQIINRDRYGQMFKEVETDGLQLAVSLLIPQEGKEFKLNAICGAGKVQLCRTYEDGRSDLLVHGEQRVRLCSILQQEPYFLMEAESLEKETTVEPASSRSLDETIALIKTWVFLNPKLPAYLTLAFDQFKVLGELVDFFVFHFLDPAAEKQRYLDCTNPAERAEKLAHFLEADLMRLTKAVRKERRYALLH